MVAIEHRQKSAIIATDTTVESTTTNLTTSSPRRTSDIVNSNDITVLSPSTASTSLTSSSTTKTTTTTTTTTNTNIIVVKPKDLKDNEQTDLNTSPNLQKLSPKMSQSSSEASTVTAVSAATAAEAVKQQQQQQPAEPAVISKSAVSQRNVDIQVANKSSIDKDTQELTKKILKLDLTGKELDEMSSIKSPKSPIATRLPHQTSLTTVDIEDRKTLREALYHGIFHRHRRTIFAVGSFLRMLRSRNSSYNTIRSSSEGEDTDEVR